MDNINNTLISDSEIHNVDRLVRNNSGTKVMGKIVATPDRDNCMQIQDMCGKFV